MSVTITETINTVQATAAQKVVVATPVTQTLAASALPTPINRIAIGAYAAPAGGLGNGITFPDDIYRLGLAVHKLFDAATIDTLASPYPEPTVVNATAIAVGDFSAKSAQGRVLAGVIGTLLAGTALGDMKGITAGYGINGEVYARNLGAAVTLPLLVGGIFQAGFWGAGSTGIITTAVSLWAKGPGRKNGADGGTLTVGESLRISAPDTTAGVTTGLAINVLNAAESAAVFQIDAAGNVSLGGVSIIQYNPASARYTATQRPAGGTRDCIIQWPTNAPDTVTNKHLLVSAVTPVGNVDYVTLTWGA